MSCGGAVSATEGSLLTTHHSPLTIHDSRFMLKKDTTAQPEWDLVIAPGRAEKNYWNDLWRYRELFYILSWRDIKVRYKQTVLGVAWSVIRPLLTTIILRYCSAALPNWIIPVMRHMHLWYLRVCCPGSSSAMHSAKAAAAWWGMPISSPRYIFPGLSFLPVRSSPAW